MISDCENIDDLITTVRNMSIKDRTQIKEEDIASKLNQFKESGPIAQSKILYLTLLIKHIEKDFFFNFLESKTNYSKMLAENQLQTLSACAEYSKTLKDAELILFEDAMMKHFTGKNVADWGQYINECKSPTQFINKLVEKNLISKTQDFILLKEKLNPNLHSALDSVFLNKLELLKSEGIEEIANYIRTIKIDLSTLKELYYKCENRIINNFTEYFIFRNSMPKALTLNCDGFFMENTHEIPIRKEIKKELIRITEVQQVMGIEHSENIGYSNEKLAIPSSLTRFNACCNDMDDFYKKTRLHLTTIHGLAQSTNKHGEARSIYAEWNQNHAIGFHTIIEGNSVHLIYVNRGESHEANNNFPSVIAHTFPMAKFPQVQQEMEKALLSENKEIIASFLNSKILVEYRNQSLTEATAKSKQKIGNCSFANINFSWHVAFASRLMQQQKDLTFEQAYKQTKSIYKTARLNDRANIFCDLIINPLQPDRLQQEILMKIMRKISLKDIKKSDQNRQLYFLNCLHNRDPAKLDEFFETLTRSPSQQEPSDNLYVKYLWAESILDIKKSHGLAGDELEKMKGKLQKYKDNVNKTVQYKEQISLIQGNPSTFTPDNDANNARRTL
ncbi:MAG: hypothetical protein A3F18_05305 [Legionellales bacterium RIFCSPHIGHO2_12_FULL_37_14]|nr:MAG: hypothetical protein A3F18_05305 [Legionellales bacterium RIFCSPHIGHO2_12_FULL_37_14]